FYLLLVTGLFLLIPVFKLNPLKTQLASLFQEQIWFALSYTYDFFHASAWFQGTPFFTHLWSLSVEEQFYLIWPLVIFLTPRQHFRKLCLVGIGLGPTLRLAITLIYRNHLLPFLLNDPQLAVNVLPFSQIDAFAMGAYISRFDLPRPRVQLLALSLAVPAVGFFSDLLIKGTITPAFGYSLPLAGMYKEVWGYTLLNYLFVVAIYCTARTHLFEWFLNSKPLKYLGKISYGLYVYHYGLIAVIGALFRKYGLDDSVHSPQMFFLALMLTIIVATLSFFFLEKPLMDLKDRFFRMPSDSSKS
ncbi:MAG TPA: acyltransferase, partial [Anaerolineales bacterium]|nr:acyltransferase [Anaerolineales bacterium]